MKKLYGDIIKKLYAEIALELARRVSGINPKARVVENYIDSPEIVINLVKYCHKNIGDAFIQKPFSYLNPEDF